MSDDSKTAPASNFIRHIIEGDLASGKYSQRRWQGKPGLGPEQITGAPDPAKIRTRFPPEPNGYLHLGHAKSIFLNFGLARDYAGACHMRFDDTNPEKEEQEYVDSILDAVHWLGFDWGEHLYYASDYFDWMLACAVSLIRSGHAYVDSQSADEIRALRGTLTEPGQNSPFRARSVDENLDLFMRMKVGEFADGTHVLRAKIDMTSGNINLRDPVIYRIRHAAHHRAGDAWRVYPLYTFAHPIEDALENITHSICTLEFEAQRPFYDWLLNTLADNGLFARPLPQQIEFARLNLTYIVLSKRKLIQLVDEKHVSGWDDPRLPTLVGARRRGYSPAGFKLFTDRIGVSKSDGWIDYSVFEDAQREVLNESAPRRIAVLDPLKLIIDNYPDNQSEDCFAPNHPQQPELGKRTVPFSKELWIEHEDFSETPPKGYFRLYPPRLDAAGMMQPGNSVRLRYGFVITCTDVDHAADGTITAVHCDYLPDTKSGTPGSDSVKVKGNIHWVSAQHAYAAEVRLYDRLFSVAQPGAQSENFLDDLNPNSVTTITAQLEPALRDARAEDYFQFERHGYFVADRRDSQSGAPVFNRTVTLKDSWTKTDK